MKIDYIAGHRNFTISCNDSDLLQYILGNSTEFPDMFICCGIARMRLYFDKNTNDIDIKILNDGAYDWHEDARCQTLWILHGNHYENIKKELCNKLRNKTTDTIPA